MMILISGSLNRYGDSREQIPSRRRAKDFQKYQLFIGFTAGLNQGNYEKS
jgi:hypothetical protein